MVRRSAARELAELYVKAPEVTRRNTQVHFIQPLKEPIVREVDEVRWQYPQYRPSLDPRSPGINNRHERSSHQKSNNYPAEIARHSRKSQY